MKYFLTIISIVIISCNNSQKVQSTFLVELKEKVLQSFSKDSLKNYSTDEDNVKNKIELNFLYCGFGDTRPSNDTVLVYYQGSWYNNGDIEKKSKAVCSNSLLIDANVVDSVLSNDNQVNNCDSINLVVKSKAPFFDRVPDKEFSRKMDKRLIGLTEIEKIKEAANIGSEFLITCPELLGVFEEISDLPPEARTVSFIEGVGRLENCSQDSLFTYTEMITYNSISRTRILKINKDQKQAVYKKPKKCSRHF